MSISNIAWASDEESIAAEVLSGSRLSGVEVAPTKVWKQPLLATSEEIDGYRRFWSERRIEIVALQALLFGRPDLAIFESEEARSKTLEYLRGMMRLGRRLGARVLVFGSPKNRRVRDLRPDQIDDIAVPFFRAAGESARDEGVILCIEPNPVQYDCDFITTSAEGLELVRRVDSLGFGLQLDAAALTLSEEPLESALLNAAGSICHFHVSEPYLSPIGGGGVNHERLSALLHRIEYPNWVSVEMRHDPKINTKTELRRVSRYLEETYGS